MAALGLLRDSRVALHLRGRWQDGYEPRLRRLASDAGVASERIVSHPPANPDAMVSLAADMDIGLALEPPVSRNNDILWSNKAFTCLLGGTPVVLSRTTGQSAAGPAVWRRRRDLCPRRRRELAIALERWTMNPRALSQARSLAWRLGDERYNWEVEAPRFLSIVSEVLERRPRAISARLDCRRTRSSSPPQGRLTYDQPISRGTQRERNARGAAGHADAASAPTQAAADRRAPLPTRERARHAARAHEPAALSQLRLGSNRPDGRCCAATRAS